MGDQPGLYKRLTESGPSAFIYLEYGNIIHGLTKYINISPRLIKHNKYKC